MSPFKATYTSAYKYEAFLQTSYLFFLSVCAITTDNNGDIFPSTERKRKKKESVYSELTYNGSALKEKKSEAWIKQIKLSTFCRNVLIFF